jgi:MFS family permease
MSANPVSSNPSETGTGVTPSFIRKVAFAGMFGSFLEFFDLLIAGTASVAFWPTVYFSSLPSSLAFGLSIASYGVSNITRPLGAFIFGHLGDRLGRKNMLAWTLTLMGLGSFGIAILPSTATIGYIAPVILVILRIIEGIGVGGEVGGATGWIVEVASKSKWRGLWTGIPISAIPAATAVGTVAFIIMEWLTGPSLMAWGWRIPFVVGAVVAIVGAIIRSRLQDSIMFTDLKERGQIARRPSVDVLKELPWKAIMGTALWTMAINVQGLVISPFSLAYLLALKLPATLVLFALTAAFAIGWVLDLAGVAISDIIGRRRVIFVSIGLTLVALPFFFPLISTTNFLLIMLGEIIMFGVCPAGLGSATTLVLIAESFPTKYRYSGIGLSVGFGGFVIGSLVTFAIPGIIVLSNGVLNAWPWIIVISVIIMVPGLLSTLKLKETRGTPLT